MENCHGVSKSMKNVHQIAGYNLKELRQFFGAYFHQDWTVEVSDPDEVVHLFMNDGFSHTELLNMATNVETYAGSKADDAAVEEGIFNELGCYYLPSADGIGAKAWLYHIAKLLRSA